MEQKSHNICIVKEFELMILLFLQSIEKKIYIKKMILQRQDCITFIKIIATKKNR